MRILHDGRNWEVIDLTWDGWVAVLIEDGFRIHYRAFLPFQKPTVTFAKPQPTSFRRSRLRHTPT